MSTASLAADRLDRALTAAGGEHDFTEYPQAGHSFLNDHEGAGDKTPLPFSVLEPVFGILSPGSGYHEESARDARRRILAFLTAIRLSSCRGAPPGAGPIPDPKAPARAQQSGGVDPQPVTSRHHCGSLSAIVDDPSPTVDRCATNPHHQPPRWLVFVAWPAQT